MASYFIISAAQCRAARGLLGWTQQDLADATGISKTTIVQFETGLVKSRDDTLVQISQSLTHQGIEFVFPDGVNRRDVTSKLFVDEGTLQDEWPLFLRSFGSAETLQLVNWPEFTQEFQKLTGHSPATENMSSATHNKAALLGNWLIMPLLDTPFRIAIHTQQWQKYLR